MSVSMTPTKPKTGMSLRAESLKGSTIHTIDGQDIGKVDDFLFDDETWTIRYMVVNTGPWLFGRKVLLSPDALDDPTWPADKLPVKLTKEQVENSPDIDLAKPVSRQQEVAIHDYYHWRYYWMPIPGAAGQAMAGGPPIAGGVMAAPDPNKPKVQRELEQARREEQLGDPRLRSMNEVTGYHIQATDGEIGHADDFFVDTANWKIRFMLVNTRNWLPGRDVLVSPAWIDRVSWHDSEVYVSVTREQVENSPEYNPKTPLSREYEADLYNYYGHPLHRW